MKKLVATTAAAALAAGLSAGVANDYRIPDDIAIPSTPGVSAEKLLHVDEIQLTAGISYSPPTKHRFGRGKPSKPKKPIGRR